MTTIVDIRRQKVNILNLMFVSEAAQCCVTGNHILILGIPV